MNLPEKLKNGDDFKRGVFEKINALIDYCKSSEIRGDNRTVRINRTPSGITISVLQQNRLAASGGGSTAEYTGYFKLVLESQPVSDEPGANVDYYVNIVDGSTYDAEQNPVSGKSVCKVNNVTYQLDPYRSGMIAETSIFALKYTAPVAADPDAGTEAEAAKVEIVNLAEEGRSYLPSDTSENCWYQLGRAIVSANEDGTLNVTIQQDHQGTATNGIPQIWWYGLCED